MYKQKKTIDTIKSNESSTQYLSELFNEDEVKQMLHWADLCLEGEGATFSRRIDQGAIDNDFTSTATGELKSVITDFLKNKIGPFLDINSSKSVEFEFAFHANKKPYGIHTDSGYDESEVVYKQGIIPLKVFPEDKDIYTVILEQRCYHSSAFPNIYEDKKLQSYVEGLDFSHKMSDSDYRLYWEDTPFRRDQLRGYSIDVPFKWVVGDTVIWDRSKIHCSSDFSVTGVQSKLGLMWITKVV